jgi:hypothetical protein
LTHYNGIPVMRISGRRADLRAIVTGDRHRSPQFHLVVAVTLAICEEARFRQKLAREVLRRANYISEPEAFQLWLSVPERGSRSEFSTHLRGNVTGIMYPPQTANGESNESR